MRRLLPFTLAILFLSSFATGCVVGRYSEGPEILAEKIKDIKPSVTTKEEIISWFGPPRTISAQRFLMRYCGNWI